MPPLIGTIEVAGRPVNRWIRRGAPEAVVFVHGFGGEIDDWRLNLPALAATGMTVAALDLPGHGGSSKALESGSLAELVQAVLGYLDAEGLAHAHLVGHSMGGAIGLALLAACRPRVRSLTLIGPAGLGQPVDGTFIRSFIAAQTPAQVEPVMARLFAEGAFVTPDLIERTVAFKRTPGVTEALTKIATGGDGGSGARSGGSLRAGLGSVPTLIIWGREDTIIPAPDAEAFAGPQVEFHTIPGAGHMVQVERPAIVNGLIAEFVSR